MSRKEAMKAFIESGMELRQDDIELGRKLERERIIQLIRDTCAKPEIDEDGSFIYSEDVVDLILKESNG